MKWWKRSKIASFFIFDWQKKLISLAVAALLWYIVNFPAYEELTFSSSIVYKNLPKDLMIVEIYDTTVLVKVKGLKEKIKNLDFSKMVHFYVNLEKASPGINSYMIEIEITEPQPGVIFNPLKDKAKLKIDKISSKIVFIQPITSGNPKDGYIVDDILMDRRMITIKGPQDTLNQYNYLETIPLSIDGATNDVAEYVPLNLPKLVTVEGMDRVHVVARIIKKPSEEEKGQKNE